MSRAVHDYSNKISVTSNTWQFWMYCRYCHPDSREKNAITSFSLTEEPLEVNLTVSKEQVQFILYVCVLLISASVTMIIETFLMCWICLWYICGAQTLVNEKETLLAQSTGLPVLKGKALESMKASKEKKCKTREWVLITTIFMKTRIWNKCYLIELSSWEREREYVCGFSLLLNCVLKGCVCKVICALSKVTVSVLLCWNQAKIFPSCR